jgi:hypothetical protein
MTNVIFTIFVDIPDEKIDNPGSYTPEGLLQPTNKSLIAKHNFLEYKDRLISLQQDYTNLVGSDYKVFGADDNYTKFANIFATSYPQISEYDIVNFYKHHLMLELSKQYDKVCYFDLDIIPSTTDNIFECFDFESFIVPDSNDEAFWGKTVQLKYYNTCIRNPATKYWNAHAMLSEIGLEPDRDVYNTGIMIASKEIIKQLDYFGDFDQTLDLMTAVKTDQHSMYPKNIQRVFNYDNETVFSYKMAINDVNVTLLDKQWHFPIKDGYYEPDAKFYHVIDKDFARFFK